MSVFEPKHHHDLSGTLVIKRPKKKPKNEEASEQKKFVKWARGNGINLQHQNNGASSKSRRMYLNQMGCTPGAADILIFDRLPSKPNARGLALEFKSSIGRQSASQKSWQKSVESQGWEYQMVRSSEEAIKVCHSYGLAMR